MAEGCWSWIESDTISPNIRHTIVPVGGKRCVAVVELACSEISTGLAAFSDVKAWGVNRPLGVRRSGFRCQAADVATEAGLGTIMMIGDGSEDVAMSCTGCDMMGDGNWVSRADGMHEPGSESGMQMACGRRCGAWCWPAGEKGGARGKNILK
jgi:hypothetical protein